MPLIRIDLYKGRTPDELKTLLDALHDAMVEAFKVPPRDRFQIVNEHNPTHMIMEDVGLDIPRTEKMVFIQVTTRPRAEGMKEDFYRLTAEAIKAKCGIESNDLMVSFVDNSDEDWSFGYGKAQFLTGDL